MFGKKKEKKNFEGITIYTAFHHVNGLPIPENVLCEVFSYPDRIDFKSGTTEIKLPKEKITDISIKTDTEIQQQLVSSAGGAIAGAMLFGSLGAIIGGRVKTKKVKTTTNYLIITYKSENELKYIGFDIQNNPSSADKLVKEFQKSNSASGVKIELWYMNKDPAPLQRYRVKDNQIKRNEWFGLCNLYYIIHSLIFQSERNERLGEKETQTVTGVWTSEKETG